ASFTVPGRQFRDIAVASEKEPFRLVYVSHASPYKHQWHVIEAVKRIREARGWPIRLDMLGPKSVAASVKRIEDAIRRHDPKGEWVAFHGPQPRSSVQKFLTEADAGV